VGGACGTHGRGEKSVEGFGGKARRDHLEDQGVDGIRMDLRETGLGGVYWIRLAQDRDRWRAVVNAVMYLRVFAPRSLYIYIYDTHTHKRYLEDNKITGDTDQVSLSFNLTKT
jgi:hypothetical protein